MSLIMPIPKRITRCLIFCLVAPPLFAVQVSKHGSTRAESHPGPAIVSPEYPKDSRAETVYEEESKEKEEPGKEQKEQPQVPGEFLPPMPIKTSPPKYPKSLKRAHGAKDVTLMGVIAENGDFIDARMVDAVEADVAKAALDAVAQWKFHPATLDGKPVAERTKVVVSFRIF